ncbi:porin [Caballeronia sp. J97]|uniref:porin n=1 Tax=Caballeronia sp. J97 TaxID=2805429 RepID=UPI002AAFF2C1|nr:porin [Caballeronia sp. J97]
MKKSVSMPLAAAAAALFASSSFAQSKVTLFGLIDEGFNYLSSAQTARPASGPVGHSQYSLQDGATGGLGGSRWGLRGEEDLGAGLTAIFQLEGGFSINNGTLAQGGALFGRQAYVGLNSKSLGAVTLGRQYDSVVSFVQLYSAAAQWGGYIGAHPGDIDNLVNTRRINNAVKYSSTDFRGLTFGGLYSLGGVPGSVGRNQLWSAGFNYSNGPFGIAAAYLNARNPNFSFFGTNPNNGTTVASNNFGSAGSATAPEVNTIQAGYASANTAQIIAAGASYKIGAATLGAVYSNVQYRGLGNTATSGPNPLGYTGSAVFNTAEGNFKYQITPALLAGAAYVFTKNSGAGGLGHAIYQQGSTGLDYFLSKRTDTYMILVYQHASGTDSLGRPAIANIMGQTASASNHQVALRLGIRHKF